jgi:Saxitoxin biosynthesis operon protein SxtJ
MTVGPKKVKKSGTLPLSPDKARSAFEGVLSTLVMDQSTHENFSRDEATSPGSDRTFGLVMAAALALVGAVNFHHSGRLWPWELVLAVLFLAAALLKASLLNSLNRLWMKLGLVLHRIVNPIVMGLLFYGTIWPTGIVMRMRGRDLLRLKREPSSDTYWIARAPGPQPETMRDQF